MNRLFFMMGLLLVLIVPQAWGSTSQYPNPFRQTMWNDFTDGMHTLGQSPKQAALDQMKLHAARARTRISSIKLARRKAWLNGQ